MVLAENVREPVGRPGNADLELNLFYDDGEGYIDLGLDNTFDFDGEGGEVDGQAVGIGHVGGGAVVLHRAQQDLRQGL